MRIIQILLIVVLVSTLQACSLGHLRAVRDAMAEQNGEEVYYPNQSDSSYTGDVKFIRGVWNDYAYFSLDNTGDEYCRARVTHEDGTEKYYNLRPYEDTGDMDASLYNLPYGIYARCGNGSQVFDSYF